MGMTTNEAIEILRKNRPTSDPRPCGMELCDAVDMAISALRQCEHFCAVTKKVEPLTMDELRRMEGQPVYIVENTEYWAIVNSFDQAGVYLLSYGNPDDYGYFGLYGKTWLAYRQKPEEGTV